MKECGCLEHVSAFRGTREKEKQSALQKPTLLPGLICIQNKGYALNMSEWNAGSICPHIYSVSAYSSKLISCAISVQPFNTEQMWFALGLCSDMKQTSDNNCEKLGDPVP